MKLLFGDLGVKVVPGQRFLGGFVGDQKGTRDFVESKVQMCTRCGEKLTMAAGSQPQAAYAALSNPFSLNGPTCNMWCPIVARLYLCVIPSMTNFFPEY